MSNVVDSTYGVLVYMEMNKKLWSRMKENLESKLGEGNKIFFWKDK